MTTTTALSSLSIKKKITALFTDETRKQNLGIASVAEILKGYVDVPVEVDASSDESMSILRDLATATSLNVVCTPEGYFLRQAAVEDAQAAELVLEEEPAIEILTKVNDAPATPKAEVPATPKVEAPAAPIASVEIPAQLTRGGLIILGPKEVYTNCEQALTAFRAMLNSEPLPEKYHHDLTKTFLNGKAEGQIQSLFKDVKRYGIDAMAAKLNSFRVHANSSTDPLYAKYRAWLQHGALPHHTFTFINNRTDSNFFKFWALMEIFKGIMAGK